MSDRFFKALLILRPGGATAMLARKDLWAAEDGI